MMSYEPMMINGIEDATKDSEDNENLDKDGDLDYQVCFKEGFEIMIGTDDDENEAYETEIDDDEIDDTEQDIMKVTSTNNYKEIYDMSSHIKSEEHQPTKYFNTYQPSAAHNNWGSGVYTHSFALYPADYQPCGAVNIQRSY